MNDIGVVEYSKDLERKCIYAKWYYVNEGKKSEGTGIAIGNLTGNYEGEFKITYYNRDNVKLQSYDLVITKTGDCYELEWFANGVKKFFGIGFEYEGKLFAGWRIFANKIPE